MVSLKKKMGRTKATELAGRRKKRENKRVLYAERVQSKRTGETLAKTGGPTMVGGVKKAKAFLG